MAVRASVVRGWGWGWGGKGEGLEARRGEGGVGGEGIVGRGVGGVRAGWGLEGTGSCEWEGDGSVVRWSGGADAETWERCVRSRGCSS